ncbi:MAG: penicillin-binding transpeptidase domain-containing protein [Acidimicrobiales bacterium]
MSRRIRILGIAMVACFAVLFLQLNNLQVLKAHEYASNPNNPQVIAQEYTQPRGTIVSADGQILAQSVPSNTKGYRYVRQYPPQWAALFSHVVGVFSYDYAPKGGFGVEGTYDKYLVAHNAPVKTLGDLLTTRTVTDTVTLTISTQMQQAAANALAASGSPVGAVVALNPSTGAVLALYSNPNYDPNPLAAPDGKTEAAAWKGYTSRGAQGFDQLTALSYERAFPPGSTFKTITTSAAYDHAPQLVGKYYPVLGCTKLPQSDKQLCNFHGGTCGGNIAVMLPPSCDTGYALLGIDIGGDNLYAEATSFGFDSRPPIDLPTTPYSVSNFPTPAQLAPGMLGTPGVAYSAIGQQDVQANALQMAMVAAGIADNGVIMTPHVMAQVRDSQGNLVTRYKPAAWRTATSQQTAQAVNHLMTEVAQFGTAAGIFPAPENVAAKTGTAETNNGASTTDWMIAFAPANAPKVAVAVVVPDEPGGVSDQTGAAVAGPIVRAIIAAALAQP